MDRSAALIELLGKNVTSPEAAKVLALYPDLEPDDDEEVEGDVRYLRSEDDGLQLKLSGEGELLAVFFMSEGKEGFAQFQGRLPGGLTFDSRPSDALKAFGAPGHSQQPKRLGAIEVGEFLRFDFNEWSLHLQFRPARGGVDLATAMLARVVPGRNAPGVELP